MLRPPVLRTLKSRIPLFQIGWSPRNRLIGRSSRASYSNTSLKQDELCCSYREYREKQEASHAEWLKKKEEHDEKVARGEEVAPLEPDPTAVHEVGILGLLKFLFYLVLIITLAGKFITGSYLWDYESRWLQVKTYLPVRHDVIISLKISLIPSLIRTMTACSLSACSPNTTAATPINQFTSLWVYYLVVTALII
jgi:hypothetical protein